MSLTPQDVQSQQFNARFRGYDMDEVDEFLERVADEMLTLIQENKQLRERIEGLKRDLSAYREQERSFQKAIISAQQIADEMKEKSEAEAKRVLEQAREEADALLQQAHTEVATVERRLDELRAQKEEIKEELRAMLTSYLARLDEEPAAGQTEPAAPSARPVSDHEEAGGQQAANRDKGPDDASLGELYEKIDLPATFFAANEEEDEEDAARAEGRDEEDGPPMSLAEITASTESEEDDDRPLPDLDGEMLFNLDDPLDDLAPDIKIKDDDRDG